jgi:hypothetical protein
VLEDNEVVDNIFWGNNLTQDSHWVSGGVGYRVVFDTYHQQANGYPDGGLGNNRIHHNLVGSNANDFDAGWLYFIGYSTNGTYNLAQAQSRWPNELHDDFEADPHFADPDAGQFMLLMGSPAIDQAVDDGGFIFTGAAPDLGRYEFVP